MGTPRGAAGGWPALAAVVMPLPRCGSSGRRVVVRTSGSVRRAADGQQPTAVGTNSTVAELWQIVGALGRCCLGYLQPSDAPSRSLPIRCSCRGGSWDLTQKRSLGPPQRFRRVIGQLSETDLGLNGWLHHLRMTGGSRVEVVGAVLGTVGSRAGRGVD